MGWINALNNGKRQKGNCIELSLELFARRNVIAPTIGCWEGFRHEGVRGEKGSLSLCAQNHWLVPVREIISRILTNWQMAYWWLVSNSPLGTPRGRYDEHSSKSSLSCETKVYRTSRRKPNFRRWCLLASWHFGQWRQKYCWCVFT
jgi:hypothetical protein